MSKTFKTVVIIFTIIFVVFSAMFGVLSAQIISELSFGDEIYIEGLDAHDEQVGMLNFLLIGVDDGGFRSDTIMLASVDGYSNRVNILSIPRDTKVKAKGYTTQKINALIGFGKQQEMSGKIDEPEEILIDMVKELTGLPVHYFVTVDFDGFKDIIDALDGVDFNVPYNMNYDDPVQDLHIHLNAGLQHLDGQAAHDFIRFRHNNNGTAPGEYVMGDEGRQYWQQEFIKELVRQKCSPKYIAKIDDLFEVLKDNVRTNYTMKDLAKHLHLVQKINLDEIGSYQLPGAAEYINGVSWYIYNKEETKLLINEVFLPKSAEEWEEHKAKYPNGFEAEFKSFEASSANTATAAASVVSIDNEE